ncbi:hypothetical protein RND81_04G066200 [Saponaria officinalis]|uniref:Uncharacterized protein n=1 Tax=Saponaria officinalis TaxID=3572 RepID=A0AAW1LI16_SAPOF
MQTYNGNSKNPWNRKLFPNFEYSDEEINYFDELVEKRPKFCEYSRNTTLDINTKRAALRISPSVVALISYSGEEELCQGCGTIIEVDNDNNNFVFTSANLIRRPTREYIVENNLADNLKVLVIVADGKSYGGEIVVHDFHYNILVLRFQSPLPLRAASLAHINDSLSLCVTEERSFELRPHAVKLVPGDPVVAFGRYSTSPFDIMAAPGIFRLFFELHLVLC